MALGLQSKQILPLLAEAGVPHKRTTLAAMSDALGLVTRVEQTNAAGRRWTRQQVELIILAFRLRRMWTLEVSDLCRLLDEGEDAVDQLARDYRASLERFVTLGTAVRKADLEADEDPVAMLERGAA
jgi:hypothetical protein